MKKKMIEKTILRPALVLSQAALLLGSACGTAQAAEDDYFRVSGYVRTWLAMNLQNNTDQTSPLPGVSANAPLGGKNELMMARGSLQLAADFKTGPVTWRAVARADREKVTAYMKDLQARACNSATVAGSPTGPGCNVRDQYNQAELRELYGDFKLGERVSVRLGKQQVVFGETDFFHPNDLLHGFDNRWRAFGEPESDELRKPLIMANVKIAVPEANGSLQVVVRPGWDRHQDIGNTYDIFGGRWSSSPNMGNDYLAYATAFDYKHPDGDVKSVTGAVRWTGVTQVVNYSLGYQRVFQPDFSLNPCGAFAAPSQRNASGCVSNLSYGKTPGNKAYGDWFYPIIDVAGFSVSGESTAIDSVLNFEMAYQKGRVFNTNSDVSGIANSAGYFQIPNNGGVMGKPVKKDVIQTTLRADKQLRLQNLIGTNGPSFSSVQIFDTWLKDFNRNDDILAAVGSAARQPKHATIGTAFIQLPYMNSRLVYGIAVGREFQARNSFLIPSVAYNLGNNWRFSLDAVLIHSPDARTSNIDQPGNDSSGFAAFNHHNYATFRATYQF